MMYYRKALELQAFLDMAKDDGNMHMLSYLKFVLLSADPQHNDHSNFNLYFPSALMNGYKAAELNSEEQKTVERSLWAQCQAVADMKFTYVVSCQQYGIDKRSGDSRAQDILRLMTVYGS